jgi:creatinine amidohydrolase
MPQSVMWKELTAAELRAKAEAGAVVLMPVGSMEQHGPHLPVGVDTFLSEGLCRAAAETLAAEMAVVVAPTLWCGMAEHHMAYGGTFTLDIPTYRAVLGCLLKSLERHGFKRVLALRVTTPYEPAQKAIAPILEDQERVHHACEVETSMMMVVAPDTVRRDTLAEAHGPPHWTPQPAGTARYVSFREATASGVIGDARRANAQKGEKLVAAISAAIVAIVRDQRTWG